jgi:hypothetical protein
MCRGRGSTAAMGTQQQTSCCFTCNVCSPVSRAEGVMVEAVQAATGFGQRTGCCSSGISNGMLTCVL